MKLTKYAVSQKLSLSAIVLALLVLGIYGFVKLPVDFLPSITYPMIKIHIWWRGATPEEIDKNIADVIEQQMATVDDLDYLESSSIEGMYTLLVNFRYGIDVNAAYQDVLAGMARAARSLPTDMDPAVVIKADPSQLPVVQMTISSENEDLIRLRTWTDNWLKDQMLAVPGVAGTEIVGGIKREIRVHIDPDALEKYKLTLALVNKRLKEENIDQFGGRITTQSKEIIARVLGEYKDLEQIRSVVLQQQGEAKVYLRDIATVSDSGEEARVITRLNGNPCVKLSVLKQSSANTVEVARAVEERIQKLRPFLPEGIELGMVENQADYVKAALDGVRNAAIEAAILLILLVYLFLGSFRQVFSMILALLITLILNFGMMKVAGFSLNIFSLGGLVIALGVLLDNSTVVIENITRFLQDSKGNNKDESIINATSEIGPAVFAATLSFLALFLPFLFVPGLASLLFREMILVIAVIVIISLLVALSVTPMLMSAFLKNQNFSQIQKSAFEKIFEKITKGYVWSLGWSLRARWLVLVIFIIITCMAFSSMGELESEFLPSMDDGRIMVKVKLPTGASIQQTNNILSELEEQLESDKPITESCFTLVGGRVWGLHTYEIANEGEINIQLFPKAIRKVSTENYIRSLRQRLSKISVPGGNIMVMKFPIKGIRKMGDADIEVKISGQSVNQLFTLAQKTSVIMQNLQEFTNVNISMDMTKPEYQVQIDRKRACDMGVSIQDVADTMRSLITGAIPTQYREENEYYNIRVMVPEKKFTSAQDVENLLLTSRYGGYLRIHDIAKVNQAVGPVEIVRENQVKQVLVRGDANEVSVGKALSSIKEALKDIDKPAGYEFSYGGQGQLMGEMQQTVFTILIFSIFFSFIILVVQFNSLELPSMILGSVPFCLAGFILLMLWTNSAMGATVIIGILVVVSATISDGVLLLTFAKELEESKKLSTKEAVLLSAELRFRPRLMTTLTTLVGFLPLALALEEGGDMLQPMAMGAIGGLVMEIFVALFLMPCLYVIFSKK